MKFNLIMRNNVKIRFFITIFALCLSAIAEANQHLCPSVHSIKNVVKDPSMMSVWDEWSPYGDRKVFSVSSMSYFGPFDTQETWYFYYESSGLVNDTAEAWRNFQNVLNKIQDRTRYAEDKVFQWDCLYISNLDEFMIARLMSP
jgi:hypothetical protein